MENKAKLSGMAVCDQPREKLINKGAASLTNTEILAIILRNGSREESVLQLASRIMNDCDNSFRRLSQQSVEELINKYKGIGTAKAVEIVASTEIVRRSQFEKSKELTTIQCSQDIFEFMYPIISTLEHEEFWVIYLNRANKIISHQQISKGGFAGTVTDIRIIYRKALENRASSIIICHNHPSGNNTPSNADKKITNKIAEAGKVMDIILLDHIIVAGNNYYGFADNGEI